MEGATYPPLRVAGESGEGAVRTLAILAAVIALQGCAGASYKTAECRERMVEQGSDAVSLCNPNPVVRAVAAFAAAVAAAGEEVRSVAAKPAYALGYGAGKAIGKKSEEVQ